MASSVLVTDGFHPGARALRAHFDGRFGAPLEASSGRFVWDYWNVPDQYRLLRTPAYELFPRAAYTAFHRRLVEWGRRTLGCHDVSPPWLSCYVDGCEQKLHGDLPHGPWAFVYSLTQWEKRRFLGGETLLLRDSILSYWEGARSGGLESGEIFRKVAPRFNRLVAFDPRIPHGVERVGGVHDVRDGRLVIHGWFVNPRPFIEGPLPRRALQSAIDGLGPALERSLAGGPPVGGMASFRFSVGASGRVSLVRLLAHTLRGPRGHRAAAALAGAKAYLSSRRFARQRGSSTVTLPLVFTPGPA